MKGTCVYQLSSISISNPTSPNLFHCLFSQAIDCLSFYFFKSDDEVAVKAMKALEKEWQFNIICNCRNQCYIVIVYCCFSYYLRLKCSSYTISSTILLLILEDIIYNDFTTITVFTFYKCCFNIKHCPFRYLLVLTSLSEIFLTLPLTPNIHPPEYNSNVL
jgi:hypothetical protein